MGIIKPLQKNKRNCEKCFAGYCINGDPSDCWIEGGFWEEVKGKLVPIKIEGLCEFCRPTGKYSLNKNSLNKI